MAVEEEVVNGKVAPGAISNVGLFGGALSFDVRVRAPDVPL